MGVVAILLAVGMMSAPRGGCFHELFCKYYGNRPILREKYLNHLHQSIQFLEITLNTYGDVLGDPIGERCVQSFRGGDDTFKTEILSSGIR